MPSPITRAHQGDVLGVIHRAQETVAKDLGELVAWRVDVDYQFNPNGGLSLVDKINRIEALLTRED